MASVWLVSGKDPVTDSEETRASAFPQRAQDGPFQHVPHSSEAMGPGSKGYPEQSTCS